MKTSRSFWLWKILTAMVYLVIARVTVLVVWGYRNYFPPNFDSDFLIGREGYFWGSYHWAFYTHLASGPLSLILGTILVNNRFRQRFPRWHRRLGRIQVICVLFLIVPSGLWMGLYAASGPTAAIGFVLQAIVTGFCVAAGWRFAVLRRFKRHQRWMWRCYLLLCSAVVIRVFGGVATVFQIQADWVYQLQAWISWIGPLAIYELTRWLRTRRSWKQTTSIGVVPP